MSDCHTNQDSFDSALPHTKASQKKKHRSKIGRQFPYFQRYQIRGEVGRGGMGCVYKAYDTTLERLVAIKMLLVGEAAAAIERQRFLREAKTTAKLNHPHIVQIYEYGEFEGRLFLVMEYLHGSSLKERLAANSINIKQSVDIMIKIAKAIHYAHQNGIVHRDLKPQNIMVTEDDEPKVMDFGLAKLLSSAQSQQLSKTGDIMGTIKYMPPEQAEGKVKEIDERSDIYGLGAVFYVLLTGTAPFSGDTTMSLLQQIFYQQPLPPTQIRPEIPKTLEAICLKALAKEKNARYQSAALLAQDLLLFQHKKLVSARNKKSASRPQLLSENILQIMLAAMLFVAVVLVVAMWPAADNPLPEESVRERQARIIYQDLVSSAAAQNMFKRWQILTQYPIQYRDTESGRIIERQIATIELGVQATLEKYIWRLQQNLQKQNFAIFEQGKQHKFLKHKKILENMAKDNVHIHNAMVNLQDRYQQLLALYQKHERAQTQKPRRIPDKRVPLNNLRYKEWLCNVKIFTEKLPQNIAKRKFTMLNHQTKLLIQSMNRFSWVDPPVKSRLLQLQKELHAGTNIIKLVQQKLLRAKRINAIISINQNSHRLCGRVVRVNNRRFALVDNEKRLHSISIHRLHSLDLLKMISAKKRGGAEFYWLGILFFYDGYEELATKFWYKAADKGWNSKLLVPKKMQSKIARQQRK